MSGRAVRLAVFIAVVSLLVGCTTRPAESPDFRGITPSEAVAINDEPTPASAATLMERRDTITILALSGGGSSGAYGVGVLNGWTKAGTRPKFDIVTGVSTGALISVFAFLGPQYDGLLEELYTTQTHSDIFRKRGVAGLFSDSLYDNNPLKQQIEQYVDQTVVDQVAAEHESGRRLYVATTNLDAGELVVWDMGLLASGGASGRADKLQLFQKVLRASSAIPVFFPPVYIKPRRGVQLRQAHVDGGVKAPVLLSDFLFQQPAKRRELYVVINSHLGLEDAYEPIEANIRSIAAKSVSSLTRELTQQAVYRGYVRARNSGTGFFLTAIPEEIPPLKDSLEFDPKHLKRLFEAGEREFQKPDFWWRKPPTIKRFDTVEG